MIILLGESGSGKSSIEKELEKTYNYKRVIQYTTRPKRDKDIDDIDYHFISDDTFNHLASQEFFIETTSFNNWKYGTSKKDCSSNSVIVANPYGFRQIKKRYVSIHSPSFYIKVPRADRLIKMIERGDDIEEAYRRNLSDVGMFTGIEDEVTCVIENYGYRYSVEEMAKIIHNYYINNNYCCTGCTE